MLVCVGAVSCMCFFLHPSCRTKRFRDGTRGTVTSSTEILPSARALGVREVSADGHELMLPTGTASSSTSSRLFPPLSNGQTSVDPGEQGSLGLSGSGGKCRNFGAHSRWQELKEESAEPQEEPAELQQETWQRIVELDID